MRACDSTTSVMGVQGSSINGVCYCGSLKLMSAHAGRVAPEWMGRLHQHMAYRATVVGTYSMHS